MKTEIEVLQDLIKEVKLLNEKWLEVLKSIPNREEPYVHDYTASPTFPTSVTVGEIISTDAPPVMAYKGYTGTIEWDETLEHHYGHLLNLTDSVHYLGDTKDDLFSDFINAVDEYLEDCKELGREPR